MIYITNIRLSGGTTLQHIEMLRWLNPATNKTGDSTRQTMVDWIDKEGGDARVRGPDGDVAVTVVHVKPPYIKTKPNKTHEDNLLSLPKF